MVEPKSEPKPGASFSIEDNVIKASGNDQHAYEFKDCNVGRLILESLSGEPDHVGLIDAAEDTRTTFAEMRRDSVRCALWMRKMGVGPGDVVTICTNNQVDDYVPVLATFYVGAIFNPWYYGIELREARRLMQLLRPRLIFAYESTLPTLLQAANSEHLKTKIILIERHSKLYSLRDILADQPITDLEIEEFRCLPISDPKASSMILLSSGSLGPPKCIEHTAGSAMQYYYESWLGSARSRNICLWYASLYWYSGTINFLEWIINGKTRVLHENYDYEETCKVIEKYKVEILVLPVTLMKDLLRHDAFKLYEMPSLKCISVGGSYLSQDLLEQLKKLLPNVHVDNFYGLTEVGSRCNDPASRPTKLGSIGFLKSNMQMKVIDPKTGETLGPNRIGELCFKSATAMTGYYKDPEATSRVIDEQGWLHSGDLGYYDEKGEIVYMDRLTEVMRFRDNEVSPIEIEQALVAHPEVLEACVVPVPHSTDNHHPMAFVKKVPGAKLTEEDLVQVSSELGDSKKLRGGVRFVDEIPKAKASGKVRRKSLKEMAKAYALL
ncbi:luciferin 4-monooxygenase-like isoform X2 [Nasonia vitripennis]|uniref:Luciferin 4-monooxygenase n=1 Tax=Nasonia vitripennis TaxID=7425 RepID=A0A7M7H5S8_NASVI|nr:luciferin 4-monooxygenase-like isoform X2 [Nasonia vitripennis]